MTLKDFLPPILVRLARDAAGFSDSREFRSYEEALKSCSIKGYENDELCNMIADKTVALRNKLEQKPFELKPSNAFLSYAICSFICRYSKSSIKILDVGGACGAHYFETRKVIPRNISMKWYVVETAQMVKSATGRGLSDNELQFVSSAGEIATGTDFIHSSCTLHYVPDPYGLTRTILDIGAEQIFFNRMMFNENDRDFITVQTSFLSDNGPGPLPEGYRDRIIKYPHTTLSFNKLNSMITGNGYDQSWIVEDLTGIHQVKGEKIIGRGLLYTKK